MRGRKVGRSPCEQVAQRRVDRRRRSSQHGHRDEGGRRQAQRLAARGARARLAARASGVRWISPPSTRTLGRPAQRRQEEPGVEALRRDLRRDPARDRHQACRRRARAPPPRRLAHRGAPRGGDRRPRPRAGPRRRPCRPGTPRAAARRREACARAAAARSRRAASRTTTTVPEGSGSLGHRSTAATALYARRLRYAAAPWPTSSYQPLFEHAHDETPYRRLDDASRHVEVQEQGGRTLLTVGREALRLLAARALDDISHLLRPGHLAQLRKILDDPEASPNDRFVALELLINANIAAGRVLPGCQDTGTAIAIGYKGEDVYTGIDDAEALSARHLRHLPAARTCATRRSRRSTSTPRRTRARTCRRRSRSTPCRAASTTSCSWPRAAAPPTRRSSSRRRRRCSIPASLMALPRREDPLDRHLGLPALSPRDRDRRHLGRAHAQDGEARQRARARRPADARQRARPRVPRSAARGARCSACATRSASAPSSAASTSRTTCA